MRSAEMGLAEGLQQGSPAPGCFPKQRQLYSAHDTGRQLQKHLKAGSADRHDTFLTRMLQLPWTQSCFPGAALWNCPGNDTSWPFSHGRAQKQYRSTGVGHPNHEQWMVHNHILWSQLSYLKECPCPLMKKVPLPLQITILSVSHRMQHFTAVWSLGGPLGRVPFEGGGIHSTLPGFRHLELGVFNTPSEHPTPCAHEWQVACSTPPPLHGSSKQRAASPSNSCSLK